MNFGGISWSKGFHKKQGVLSRYICKYCGRQYKMEWARNNHQKLCGGEIKNE